MNDKLKNLIRLKRDLRYRNCSSNWKNPDLKNKYKETCKYLEKEYIQSRKNYETKIIEESKDNPKQIFQYIKSQQNVKSSIKALKDSQGKLINTNEEIADLLNKTFQDVFVREDDISLESLDLPNNRTNNQINFDLYPDSITFEEVSIRLKDLDISKAIGPDLIHPIVLKNCSDGLVEPLTLIYRESIKQSELPLQWKSSNIIPRNSHKACSKSLNILLKKTQLLFIQ